MISADLTLFRCALRGPFAGNAGSIAALVEPVPELLTDGQKMSELAELTLVLDPSNWTTAEGGTTSVSAPVITRYSSGIAFPSSLNEVQEQGDTIWVDFVVSDTSGSHRYVTLSYLVEPVATVAIAGIYALEYTLASGIETVLFTDLFAPEATSPNWIVPNNRTLIDAPAGVTLAANSLQIDTALIVPQTATAFHVIVSDTVLDNGALVQRTATKNLTLTTLANGITILEMPELTQGFVGGLAADSSNMNVLVDPANYGGLVAPSFNVWLQVGSVVADAPTYAWAFGDEAVLHVDIWNAGRTVLDGLPDASFQSLPMIVQQLLSLSADTGIALEIIPNPAAPDTYPVNGVLVNGRGLDAGLTVLDFKSAEMKMIQSPVFTAAGGTELGQFTAYTPPTIVAPIGAVVTVTYDLINEADGAVLLADIYTTNDTLTDEIIPSRQGLSVFWRAKFRAVGFADLDVDSAILAIDDAPVIPAYDPNVVSTQGTAYLSIPALPNERYQTLFMGLSGSPNYAIRQGNVNMTLQVNGNEIIIACSDSGNVRIVQGTSTGAFYDPTQLNAVLCHLDAGNGVDQLPALALWINGNPIAMDYSGTGIAPGDNSFGTGFLPSQSIGITARSTGTFTSDFELFDPLIHYGSLIPASTFFNPDGSTKDTGVVSNYYQQGGAQVAAEFNAGTNLVTGGVSISVGSSTFVDVV